jgi:hypothetical protein
VSDDPVYEYIEPVGESCSGHRIVRRTRSQILAEYGPYWRERMRQAGHADQVSDDACVEDWCVVNWAEEVAALPDAPKAKP